MMPNLLPHAASAIDATLFDTVRTRLFTAVIGDVMDAKGLTHPFLPPEIHALAPDLVIVGRAMPV